MTIPTQLFVDGSWRPAGSGRSTSLTNPATEEAFAEVASADVGDVNAAVESAHKAWIAGWRDLSPGKRTDILFNVARALRDNVERIARLETLHIGKPIADARDEAALGARVFARDSRSSCAQTVSGIEAQREIADMSDPVFDEQLLAQRAIEIASLAERVVEEDFGVFLVMLLGDPNRAALTNVIAALRPQEDPKEVLMGYTRKLLELRASDGVLTEPWRSMLSTFGVTATEETVPAPVAG